MKRKPWHANLPREPMTCSKCGLICETTVKVSNGRGQKLSLCCNAPAERKK